MGYEDALTRTRKQLAAARNSFNNCIDSELLDIVIKEITVLEEYQNYYIRKIKEERKELQLV